jgi:hypothetical protein
MFGIGFITRFPSSYQKSAYWLSPMNRNTIGLVRQDLASRSAAVTLARARAERDHIDRLGEPGTA